MSKAVNISAISGAFAALYGATYIFIRQRYALPKSNSIAVAFASLSWAFGFFGTVFLTFDLATYRESYDLHRLSREVPDVVVKGSWTVAYWFTFALTWFVLPVLIAVLKSGEFEPLAKLADAAKGEARYYVGMAAVVSLVAGIAVLTEGGTDTLENKISPVLVAVSNAYGQFLVVICLGSGLARVPVHLWMYADPALVVKREEQKAERAQRAFVASKCELVRVTRTLRAVAKITATGIESEGVASSVAYLIEWLDQIGSETYDSNLSRVLGLGSGSPPRDDDDGGGGDGGDSSATHTIIREWSTISSQQKRTKLVALHVELKDTLSAYYQARGLWWHTVRTWAKARRRKRSAASMWIRRAGSVLCGALSACVLWDEITLPFPIDLSILGVFFRQFDGEIVVTPAAASVALSCALFGIFYTYASVCTYLSFLAIRIPGGAKTSDTHVYPHRLSEASATLFVGCYISRMQFSLGYHFLMIMRGRHGELYSSSFKAMYDMSTSAVANWLYAIFPLACVAVATGTILRDVRGKIKNPASDRLHADKWDLKLARDLLRAAALRLHVPFDPEEVVRTTKREDTQTLSKPLLSTTTKIPCENSRVETISDALIERSGSAFPFEEGKDDEKVAIDRTEQPQRPGDEKDESGEGRVVVDVDARDEEKKWRVSAATAENPVRRTHFVPRTRHSDKSTSETTADVVSRIEDTSSTVMEGYLSKRSDALRRWRRRFFRFDGSTLSYYKIPSKLPGSCRGRWSLANDGICAIRQTGKFSFALKVREKRMLVHLRAASSMETYRWFVAIAPYVGSPVPSELKEAADRDFGWAARSEDPDSGSECDEGDRLEREFVHDGVGRSEKGVFV